MRTKVDLYTSPVTSIAVRQFVNNITDLAISDWIDGRKSKRSGDELCDMFTSQCRRGHKRMASSIYNKVRWSLDTNWNG